MSAQLLTLYPKFRMVATDYDTELVGMAEQVLAGFGRRASAQRADAAQLPFPDGRFDLVLSAAMLHHVIDWDQALAEAVRVSGPGPAHRLRHAQHRPDPPHPPRRTEHHPAAGPRRLAALSWSA